MPKATIPPSAVGDYVWTFGRGARRVDIRRRVEADGPVLEVVGGDAPGTTAFTDMAALVGYQSRLESHLLANGWSLVSFSPERRSGTIRRAAARPALDRRRWWTDPEFRRREE